MLKALCLYGLAAIGLCVLLAPSGFAQPTTPTGKPMAPAGVKPTIQHRDLQIAPLGTLAAGDPVVQSVTITSRVYGGSDVTGTITLNKAPTGNGLQVPVASSSAVVIISMPNIMVPVNQTSATFRITTREVDVDTPATITVGQGTSARTAQLTVRPRGTVESVALSAASVVAGGAVELTFNLAEPDSGTRIPLVSNDPATLVVPEYVMMNSGQSNGRLRLITKEVQSDRQVSITVGRGTTAKVAQLQVRARAVESVTISPSTVAGGVSNQQAVLMTVRWNGASPSEGGSLSVTSSDPSAARVASPLAYSAGQPTRTAVVETFKVPTDRNVTFTIGQGASAKIATLLVRAPRFTQIEVRDTDGLGSGNPYPIIGGTSNRLNVSLGTDIGGPPGGLAISLQSSDPAILPLPATVTVPENHMNAIPLVTPRLVYTDTPVTITARQGETTKTAAVLVKAIEPAGTLSFTPRSPVLGGTSIDMSVTLNAVPTEPVALPLASSRPEMTSFPAILNFAAGTRTIIVQSATRQVSQETPVTITVGQGANAKTGIITLQPLQVESIRLVSQIVIGGTAVAGTVTINGTAPAGGLQVPLRSATTAAAVPDSVMVLAGNRGASFQIATTTVTSDTVANISAGQGANAKLAQLTVRPLRVETFSIAPQTYLGSGSGVARLVLTGPAPSGGLQLPISSSSPAVTLPNVINVMAASTNVNFPISVGAVSAETTAVITVGQGADAKTFNILLRP